MVGSLFTLPSAGLSMLDRKLVRDLWRLRGQGLAIALVVAAGVALLVAMFGCLTSLRGSRDAFYERYRFADVFAVLKRAPESLTERLARIEGVALVETRIVADVTMDIDGLAEPAVGRLQSIPERGDFLLNALALRGGRMPAPDQPFEVVASEAFADAHGFKAGASFTAIINGKKRRLTLVGTALTPEYIYSLAPGQYMPDDKRFGVLWMNRRSLAAAFDLDQAFNAVAATVRHGASTHDVIDRIDDELRRYGGFGAYERADQISHFFLTNEFAQLETTGTIVPPIFLAVAAFLLNVVLTRLLATEREQIGLLKAFGYSDGRVAWHYAKMMLALMAVGLTLGLLGGIWLGRAMTGLYSAYYRFPLLAYRVEPAVFLLAAGVTLAAGCAGGFKAVRDAARLAPAVAMSPPVPPVYRHGAISGAFAALQVSQPTRMIFRHLWRWPLRTGLNVLGMAATVGLLVASLFFLDTVEHVIEVVFFQAERQSLTVGFVEPRPARVELEVRALPGVLATEPVRSVMARLRHGPYVKRMAVSGLAPHPDLSRLLDADTNPVEPPAGGLALSRHVADQLHARPGDLVTVEVLQERRPVRQVPVTQVIEQYMGFGAYMNLASLNQLMLEGPSVSGIHVLADSAGLDTLYRRLKSMPAVGGVALTDAALAGFRTTMSNTMYVMVGFYIAFAVLIAVGVSYNGARIAFSERARALASLRVLGFTSGEVAYILMGELAIQAVLAMPLGCLVGDGLAWLMSPLLTTDMYQFPLIINASTYGLAMAVGLVASLACGAIVSRRVYHLDLVAVLKARD